MLEKAKKFLTLPDFRRLIRPITNKIFLLLGRAVLELIEKNDKGTQKIQVTALANETISDIERFQEYGLETYPKTGAEVFVAFLNGNRDHGIALCVHDSRHRPINLAKGEVCLYSDEDGEGGNNFRITMKRNREVKIECRKLNIVVEQNIAVECTDMNVHASNNISFVADNNFSHN